MIRESERLRLAAKVARLETQDPERWGAIACLLDELAEAAVMVESAIELAARALGFEAAQVSRAEGPEREQERAILAALVEGRLSREDAGRLSVHDFSSDARRALAAVALACYDLGHAPSPDRILAVLALDNDGSAVAITAGVELRRCEMADTFPDVQTFLRDAHTRRAAAEVERAARLLRQRDLGAIVSLHRALTLLEGEDAPPVSITRAA